MSKKFLRGIFFSLLFTISLLLINPTVGAQSNEDKLKQLSDQIQEYQREIERLRGQANTLFNQIAQFDAQIKLTQLRINQAEEKVVLLGGRIDQLEISLSSLFDAFSSRVVETYKMARLGEPVFLLASSSDLAEAVSRFYYLKRIQQADQGLLKRLTSAQETYKKQKEELEDLQKDLEEQNKVLGVQKTAKANLLEVTKNDERRYQDLLAKARAELEAIQAIIAGRGEEVEVKNVGEGERIASVIPTASACSTGAHLHFEIVRDGGSNNPANFLIPKEVVWDNAPDSPLTFSGSWQWPLNDPIRITQGYGMTYYAAHLKYYGGLPHTGLDMVNNNNDHTVKSVKHGMLYRGSIGCGGGTLRYVKVKQNDGYDTYYLHISY